MFSTGQLVRHKQTGKVGFVGIDPYKIRGPGEIVVSFSRATDDAPMLGRGTPKIEWEEVQPQNVSRWYRRKYRGVASGLE